MDLLEKIACSQGDYIVRQLYWQRVWHKRAVFNRYLGAAFLYVWVHSCVLVVQLTVYNVILSQGVEMIYLNLFVLGLIKLKGSVFKKQDEKSVLALAVTDGRDFFHKTAYIMMIAACVKFTPQQFYYKMVLYYLIEILVDCCKYISIFYMNGISEGAFNGLERELVQFYAFIQLERYDWGGMKRRAAGAAAAAGPEGRNVRTAAGAAAGVEDADEKPVYKFCVSGGEPEDGCVLAGASQRRLERNGADRVDDAVNIFGGAPGTELHAGGIGIGESFSEEGVHIKGVSWESEK